MEPHNGTAPGNTPYALRKTQRPGKGDQKRIENQPSLTRAVTHHERYFEIEIT
jgi:hypothetical protein